MKGNVHKNTAVEADEKVSDISIGTCVFELTCVTNYKSKPLKSFG